METVLIYPVGSSAACRYAADCLKAAGIALVDHPAPEVTHLLLDVPSFNNDGTLRGGGDISSLLRMLPAELTIIGGYLDQAALAQYKRIDLLKDEDYLARNASITAECALQAAGARLPIVFSGCPVLVIGWGRIGKCLSLLLQKLGANVSVAARKEADRAMVRAFGFSAVDISAAAAAARACAVVFNTVPHPVLSRQDTKNCPALLVELASTPGLEGDEVLSARGLPGKYAPESAGKLMAETILPILQEGSH